MKYIVNVYKNGSLEFSGTYMTYDGALTKAKQWLSDKYRSYKIRVEIIEN